MGKVKIGIDVGGTFTHAVAIDAIGLEILSKVCVPTTHRAKEGVVKGVIESLEKVVKNGNISTDDIILVAHSTTQATNALLEGDVVPVGIIGLGKGFEVGRIKRETRVGKIKLSSNKYIETYHRFINTDKGLSEEEVKAAIDELIGKGAKVIVASEAYGVDDPQNEGKVVDIATQMGILATAASHISKLYGLRIRTKTAVVNACILPKMLETAEIIDRCVQKLGIKAPLMVMRSDGGVMSIEEMKKRPILTILSGPAAGIAAALMYVRVSNGVFIEVGGTSTDISVIKNGRPILKNAEVGGQRLYTRTLSINTVGVAGGSMPRIKGKKIIDVGPRSAHIAGMKYSSFIKVPDKVEIKPFFISPVAGDPDDYFAYRIKEDDEYFCTFTPTDAANCLCLIPEGKYGYGLVKSVRAIASSIAKLLDVDIVNFCKRILDIVSEKIVRCVNNLVGESELEKEFLTLVGGGGGAYSIVPYVAEKMRAPYRIAENPEVVSAIGAALGMVKDSIERTIVNPSKDDILKMRSEVLKSVVEMGASPESVEFFFEIDKQTRRVTVTAIGSTELHMDNGHERVLSDYELRRIVASTIGIPESSILVSGETDFLKVFTGSRRKKVFFSIFCIEEKISCVIDTKGIVRLQLKDAVVDQVSAGEVLDKVSDLIERLVVYGDVGIQLPGIFLLIGKKILDLSGLISKEQILSLTRLEIENVLEDESVVVIATTRK